LEIGTHIGASTIHIALALKNIMAKDRFLHCKLITVDIKDVNDEITKPWLKYGCTLSPKDMTIKLDCSELVEFITLPSHIYFSRCNKKFDFIFLDGDHSAKTVYIDITNALQFLNKNGFILLHDYYYKLKPLWSDGKVIPGPYLATNRLIYEGNNIKVLTFGNLPWQTKMNSNATSLALLTRGK